MLSLKLTTKLYAWFGLRFMMGEKRRETNIEIQSQLSDSSSTAQHVLLECFECQQRVLKYLGCHTFRHPDEIAEIEIKYHSRFVIGARRFVESIQLRLSMIPLLSLGISNLI